MRDLLSGEQKSDLLGRGFSRRDFHRIARLLAGGALPFFHEQALAQRSRGTAAVADAVWIDANENPMGPCAEAAEAIHAIVQQCGRYLTGENSKMAATLAEQEGLSASYVQPFAGSSGPLYQAIMAFCGKDRPYVVADPSFELGSRAAQFMGAPVIDVPLVAATFAHDVKRMAAAHPSPGVIYICNPNNPTGTVTSKADIEWLVNNKPAGTIVLVDEAYIHFSSRAASAAYLAAADKEVIVLRTFSKVYGMAGLRAGAAMGRPDLLSKVSQYTGAGFLPITGMVGATASLRSKTVVPERRKIVAGIREDTFAFLAKRGIECIPSEANMFMLNTTRPGREFSQAMAREGVYVGRVWPVWPTWVRVTVGTREDMARFQEACAKCYRA
jgi:histidinol-phosphate aminotransferase